MQDKTTTAGEFNPLEMKPTNIEMHEEYVDVQLRLPIEVSARDVAIRFNAAMKGTPGYEGYEAAVINGEVHIDQLLHVRLASAAGAEDHQLALGDTAQELALELLQLVHDLYTFYQTFDSDGNRFAYRMTDSDTNRFQMTQDRFSVCPYNYTQGTLEWRAFDAPHDWSMQEGQMAFLQRYVSKVLSSPYPAAPFAKNMSRAEREKVFREFRNVYAKDIDRCIRDFKDLIVRGLELPWKRYEFYIDMNLAPAFEWGQRL